MKKPTVFFMSIVLLFSFSACSDQNTNNAADISLSANNGSVTEIMSESSKESTESSSEPSDTEIYTKEGKTLVVYFSASGNTKKIADHISSETNAETFELIPSDPYDNNDLNWTDNNSRVVYEHDNIDARNIELTAVTVENWEEYDTVFIGYPIWWGIAAWPVDTFVKSNDFTGKTVIPFCTSSSSGLGESGKLLEEMAGTGNWLEGIRFSSGASESDVREWVKTL